MSSNRARREGEWPPELTSSAGRPDFSKVNLSRSDQSHQEALCSNQTHSPEPSTVATPTADLSSIDLAPAPAPAMPPKPATKSAYGRAKETVEMSFVDLVWMLQEVPLGTPNALPALGSPLPWYILPAPLAKTKCPWTRAPNDKSRRLESIHREAARGMRQLEQAKRDARDPAEVRAEANRKKKARKLASKARREAEGGDAAAEGAGGPEDAAEGEAGEEEVKGEGEGAPDAGEGKGGAPAPAPAPAAKANAKRTPTAPKCAYALPPYISGETQAAFIEQYARVHATWDQQRWDEAEVVMPAHLKKQAVWGNAYIYPSEHSPEDPQRGLVLNPDTLTFEYHTE